MAQRFIGSAAALAIALASSGLSVSVISEEEVAEAESARREARRQARHEREEAARRERLAITSKYAPHQGKRECDRRRKRTAAQGGGR